MSVFVGNGSPVVFISYAHEGDLKEKVAELTRWLENQGREIEVITDHLYQSRPPSEGWRSWMQQSIDRADIVLIVCTDRYRTLFEKNAAALDGGYGVSWESTIITADLYQQRLHNTRFFPIQPDGGSLQQVPAVLQDWYNGHYFPSGNSGILALIYNDASAVASASALTSAPAISTPAITTAVMGLPGELMATGDRRLLPREGVVLGRDNELEQVLNFLQGGQRFSQVSGHVTGSGGIGKTEVCKAALQQWLTTAPTSKAFWVQLSDQADVTQLLQQIALAVGIPEQQRSLLQQPEQLQPLLPVGLYYLDNLEAVVESPAGSDCLNTLLQTQGTRWLVSSRVALDERPGCNIMIDRLDADAATALFLRCWSGRTAPVQEEVTAFVDQQLGGHALTITLLARLGKYHSWPRLQEMWLQRGTELARTRKGKGRIDNLDVSFALTVELLAETAGALDLWQFIALFPEGVDEEILELWESLTEQPDARWSLIDHHLIQAQDGCFTMLPPVARYGLDRKHMLLGKSWVTASENIKQFFIVASEGASDIKDSEEKSIVLSRFKYILSSMYLYLSVLSFSEIKNDFFKKIQMNMINTHVLFPVEFERVFYIFKEVFDDGDSYFYLAILKRQSGDVSISEKYLIDAGVRYKSARNSGGYANSIKAMADILIQKRELYEAAVLLGEAEKVYIKNKDDLGLGNVNRSLGEIEITNGNYKGAVLFYCKAKVFYEKINNNLSVASALDGLAKAERLMGNIAKAKEYAQMSLVIYTHQQIPLGVANLKEFLGCVFYDDGMYKNSILMYQGALNEGLSINYSLGVARSASGLMKVMSVAGNLSQDDFLYLKNLSLKHARNSEIEHVINYVNEIIAFVEVDHGFQNL